MPAENRTSKMEMINLQSGIKYNTANYQKLLAKFVSYESTLQAAAHSSMEQDNFNPSSSCGICCVMNEEESYLPTTCRRIRVGKVQHHSFLTFALHQGEHHWWLYPLGGKNHYPLNRGGWAKSQSGHLESRKISCPCQDLNAG